MGHEMTEEDVMFSVREAPWHFGETNSIVLEDNPDPEKVLEVAGLAWLVEQNGVFRAEYADKVEYPTYVPIDGWKMLTRSDTGSLLHVAKTTYGVIQNEVGAQVMEALCGADGAVKYETGGSIRGGQECYLTARLDEPTFIKGDDSPTFPYAVVTWAHDGMAAMRARATNIRVVCWNTLSASEAQAEQTGRRWTFRHSKNVMERIDEARKVLLGVREEHQEFVELANELARLDVTDEAREEFVTTFIPAPVTTEVISDRVLDNINEARAKVRSIFDSETMPEAHRNSAYGLVLAGVEYLDHLRGYRNSDTYLGRTLLREESLKARLVPLARELAMAGKK